MSDRHDTLLCATCGSVLFWFDWAEEHRCLDCEGKAMEQRFAELSPEEQERIRADLREMGIPEADLWPTAVPR